MAAASGCVLLAAHQMEKGKRQINAIELGKLSAILGFSIDQLLSSQYENENTQLIAEEPELISEVQLMRKSEPGLKKQKLENLILYITQKAGALPRMEVNVLSVLLYFCDFNYYENHEEHFTGLSYTKRPSGPSPDILPDILSEMEENGKILKVKSAYSGIPHQKYLPLLHANLKELNAAEKAVCDDVLERFAHWPASALNAMAMEEMPYKASDQGQLISYELAFYRRLPGSVRIYDEDWYGD